jgi:endonuclease/exonuclease/phosphatase family metal-dependent hydrolase
MEADQPIHRFFFKKEVIMEKTEASPNFAKLQEVTRRLDCLKDRTIDLYKEVLKLAGQVISIVGELRDIKYTIVNSGNANANKDFYDPNKDSQQLAASL